MFDGFEGEPQLSSDDGQWTPDELADRWEELTDGVETRRLNGRY